MKKKLLVLGAAGMLALAILVSGCGSSEKAAPKAQEGQQQNMGHEGHSMPKGDPMPMMKDMEKSLQAVMKYTRAGQTMDAQKSAAQMVNAMEKVQPHMMDAGLKDNLRSMTMEIKDSVNSGKMDPGAMDEKAAKMQEIMKKTTTHLQSMSH